MSDPVADRTGPAGRVTCFPVTGVGEVQAGSDLAAVLAANVRLLDGDVLVVTSKVVSKAEGGVRPGGRDEAVAGETERVVARRGRTTIVRTRHGLVLAAAGVDASNVQAGHVALLPRDPDGSARALRRGLGDLTGRNVAVVVTDTAGRAWRTGQTDIAVGVAGLVPALDYRGRADRFGNRLEVTTPAVADEVAGAADLVKGKLAGRPAAVVRGLAALVLPVGEHGAGAASLVRPEPEDLFGYGSREAVLRALIGDRAGVGGFGAPVSGEELAAVLTTLGASDVRVEPGRVGVAVDGAADRLRAAAYACGWLPLAGTTAQRLELAPSGG